MRLRDTRDGLQRCDKLRHLPGQFRSLRSDTAVNEKIVTHDVGGIQRHLQVRADLDRRATADLLLEHSGDHGRINADRRHHGRNDQKVGDAPRARRQVLGNELFHRAADQGHDRPERPGHQPRAGNTKHDETVDEQRKTEEVEEPIGIEQGLHPGLVREREAEGPGGNLVGTQQ